MAAEYIKLSKQEIIYGQKNFLKAQLDVLDLVKHYLAYQNLRKDEFTLKIELRNMIKKLKTKLFYLEKRLPAVYSSESEGRKKIELEQNSKESSALEQEIELIKRKLARLSNN